MAPRQRLAAGQGELDLGLDAAAPGGPLLITASRMGACSMPWGTWFRGAAEIEGVQSLVREAFKAHVGRRDSDLRI